MIAVVDYGLGNLASVRNALRAVGSEVDVTPDAARLRAADGVVLPGVGAASAGMRRLRALELDGVVKEVAERGSPVLGLCLGMQLLFDRSEEGGAQCLGLLSGAVRLLQTQYKVPHIGWNQVETTEGVPIWRDIPPRPYVYFVHSYVCVPGEKDVVAGRTEYGERFCSVVVRDNVWGTQFHPERSAGIGLQLLSNFVGLCARNRSGLYTVS